LKADPPVVANSAADVVDVAAKLLAQVGHFVDEADLGREQRIGDVLGRSALSGVIASSGLDVRRKGR
jgi:hypothetical protein